MMISDWRHYLEYHNNDFDQPEEGTEGEQRSGIPEYAGDLPENGWVPGSRTIQFRTLETHVTPRVGRSKLLIRAVLLSYSAAETPAELTAISRSVAAERDLYGIHPEDVRLLEQFHRCYLKLLQIGVNSNDSSS